MALVISVQQLPAEVRRRRAGRPLRVAAEESGVSAATLSRVERGAVPDIETLRRLGEWLGASINTEPVESGEIEDMEDLRRATEVYLRAKKKLPGDLAAAIADTVRVVMELELEKARRSPGGTGG